MSSKISKAYGLPTEYLLQVMQQLVKSGILTSKKGPNGGFNLAKPATEITMLEILEAIDGPVLVPMDLARQTGNKPFSVKIETNDELGHLVSSIQNLIVQLQSSQKTE